MVQRTSNGYPFTVLAPVPAVRTGIRVEIYDKDDPLTLIDVLPDTRNRKWVDPLNDPGAGEFEIHEDDPKLADTPTILDPGNIIRFYLDGIARFSARIERRHYVPVSSDEDNGRWIKVSGRGTLAQLEDGAIWPEGGLAGAAERDVTGLTPAAAFLDFYAEAAARGSIVAVVTPNFTDTLDTNNQPYNFTLDETVRVGRDDLLTIVRRWADMGVDVHMTPALELELYANGLGVDKTIQTGDTAPVVFRRGHNLKELEVDEDLIIKNSLLIETPAGFFERTEPSSATLHGRREGYLSVGNTTSGDYIDRATAAAFARLANIRSAVTAEVLDIDGHRPYVDGSKGDWVLAPDAHGDLQRFRILGITVSEDDNGIPIFVPTLNAEDAELESRLQKWLRTMTPGTLGGTATETTSPNTTTTSEAEATAEAASADAVDAHESGFPHNDEFSDLSDVDLTGLEDGQLVRYDAGVPAWVPLDFKIDLTTPPTAGQVLKYDDSDETWKPDDETGGGGGGGGRTLLKEETISSQVTSFDITGISQAHADLLIVIEDLETTDGAEQDAPHIQLGDAGGIDTGANYAYFTEHWGTSNGSTSAQSGTAFPHTVRFPVARGAAETTPGAMARAEYLIRDYAKTDTFKMATWYGAKGGDSVYVGKGVGVWQNTDAVTQVRISADDGDLVEGTIKIYGID